MPYFLFVELLGPAIEMVGLIGLGVGLSTGTIDLSFVLLFVLVAYGYGLVLSCLTLAMDELGFRRHRCVRDRLLLVLWAVIENLGYRQLTVVWRLRGLLKYLLGRGDWGVMTRPGFDHERSAA